MECQCCLSTAQIRGSVLCSNNDEHIFCNLCIVSHTNEMIGSMRGDVKCMAMGDECNGRINDHWLALSIGEEKTRLLSKYKQIEEVRLALGNNLMSCPFCSILLETDNGPFLSNRITCPNTECNMSSCRRCKKAYHGDDDCIVNKNRDTSEEEEATYDVVRVCPRCSVEIMRTFGCDHMKCACGITFCYECMEIVVDNNHPYKCDRINTPRRRMTAENRVRDRHVVIHQTIRPQSNEGLPRMPNPFNRLPETPETPETPVYRRPSVHINVPVTPETPSASANDRRLRRMIRDQATYYD